MISTCAPASIEDCVVKIRGRIERPLVGLELGKRPENDISLRQVADFLEDLDPLSDKEFEAAVRSHFRQCGSD